MASSNHLLPTSWSAMGNADVDSMVAQMRGSIARLDLGGGSRVKRNFSGRIPGRSGLEAAL